jgi:hypothetical protein
MKKELQPTPDFLLKFGQHCSKPQGLNSNFFFLTYGWGSCILPSIQLNHGGQNFQAFVIFFIAH